MDDLLGVIDIAVMMSALRNVQRHPNFDRDALFAWCQQMPESLVADIAAQIPGLPDAELERIAAVALQAPADATIRVSLARVARPLPAALWMDLYRGSKVRIARALAARPDNCPEQQQRLAKDKRAAVQIALAERGTDVTALQLLLDRARTRDQREVLHAFVDQGRWAAGRYGDQPIASSNEPLEALAAEHAAKLVAEQSDNVVCTRFLSRCSQYGLTLLFSQLYPVHTDELVIEEMLGHPHVTVAMLETLLEDDDVRIRRAASRHPSAPAGAQDAFRAYAEEEFNVRLSRKTLQRIHMICTTSERAEIDALFAAAGIDAARTSQDSSALGPLL